MPAPTRDHADHRFAYSRAEIIRSLKFQIERDGGTFIGINLKKNKFSWVDSKGNKQTRAIDYA